MSVKGKALDAVAKQLDFLETLGQDDNKITVRVSKETLPPSLGGGVRFFATIAGGWWCAYGATEQAAIKSVLGQRSKELEAYYGYR